MALLYKRGTQTCKDSKGKTGRRGTLMLGGNMWATIERADNYKAIPAGVYDCEMGYVTFSGGRKARAIRILGSYSRGRMYLHAANWPYQLQGCIAPGKRATGDGVGDSRGAMNEVFGGLGGFVVGRTTKLTVQ